MQSGQSKLPSVQGTPCAAAVLLQISAVLFPNAPSLSAVFLFPLKVFASRFLVFGSRCQIPFHQIRSDVLSLQAEFPLWRVPRVVMLIINDKKYNVQEPLYSIKYFFYFVKKIVLYLEFLR